MKRITIPTFEISSKPKVKWSDLNVKRYDYFDRAGARAREIGNSIWHSPHNKDVYAITQPQYVGKIPIRKYVQCQICTGGGTADTYGSEPYALRSMEVQLLSRAPCPVRLASLGHRPLKAEITGANPVLGTNLYETDHIRPNAGDSGSHQLRA